jgi:uncharacterized protein
MQIDVEKTVRAGGRIAADFPKGSLDWGEEREIAADRFVLKGALTRVSRGYDLDANLSGAVSLECVRCLESFAIDLDFDFRLTFVKETDPKGHPGAEVQIHGAECELYPIVEGKVEIEALVREQIYLHLPLKPICTESCRGLCASCGENLNSGRCRCASPARVRLV